MPAFMLATMFVVMGFMAPGAYVGVSENRGPFNSTLNSRIGIIRTPK